MKRKVSYHNTNFFLYVQTDNVLNCLFLQFFWLCFVCIYINFTISIDNSTVSEHRDGWSDWSCEEQGGLCFKSRTCNSTADFNCSKTSEVTVTNCPCVAGINSFLNYHSIV
jgi:hypothetical protein